MMGSRTKKVKVYASTRQLDVVAADSGEWNRMCERVIQRIVATSCQSNVAQHGTAGCHHPS